MGVRFHDLKERNGFREFMERKDIKELLERYRRGHCSDEERAWIERGFTEYIHESKELPDEADWMRANRAIRKGVFRRVNAHLPNKYLYWAVAAAVLIIVGIVWQLPVGRPDPSAVTQAEVADIDPGGERATLTLADGRKILLDEADTGQLAVDRGIRIYKTDAGEVVYEIGGEADHVTALNTIETPRGGQYKVILPDGTNVWLNAASSLTYPTRFADAERRVTLVGEAYFEVNRQYSPNARKIPIPFVVEAGIQQVEVLGTHFNVNAYADEPTTKTTLLEGAVRVTDKTGRFSRVLQPGEQCAATGTAFSVLPVDTESVMAWRNNVFYFYRTDLPGILRQIERWYDVEFDPVDMPVDIRLYGEIGKDKKLSVVLEALSANTGLHFERKGRRIAVTK